MSPDLRLQPLSPLSPQFFGAQLQKLLYIDYLIGDGPGVEAWASTNDLSDPQYLPAAAIESSRLITNIQLFLQLCCDDHTCRSMCVA